MKKVEEAMALLESILNDRGVPRNIKTSVEESLQILKDKQESEEIRIATVVSTLDDASNDPNISLYARTKIWDIASKLEELNK